MRRCILFSVVILIFVMVSVTVVANNMATAEKVDLKAAKTTFEKTCSQCHALSRPLGKKKDQAQWESTVSRMSSYHERRLGGAIPEKDQKAIIQYLLSAAGK